MADAAVTQIGGKGHSNNAAEVVVTSLGKQGNVFSGTFTGRCALYGWDFVTGIYTDKEARLSVVVIASEITMTAVRSSNQEWKLQTGSTFLGSLKYDPATGNLAITSPAGQWFQGEVMGTYIGVI